MLRRIDRLILRVPNVGAAVKYYRDVLGLVVVKEEPKLASLRFADEPTELVLHCDDDLPAEATYYRVDDVRALFAQRAELKIQFIQPPIAVGRGYRAAIKDPFGTVLLIVDRTSESGSPNVIEDAKTPGTLFAGVETPTPVRRTELIAAYEKLGRTADDLPYTPDFERLYDTYAALHRDARPTRQEVWRHLLNLRKGGKLPKLGEARSKPPEIDEAARALLLSLIGEDIGRRDRLPYTPKFDQMVDAFNKSQPRSISPHLVWRLVATLAK